MSGWIKIHRDILDNPIVCKDKDYFTVWIYLLLKATHKEIDMLFNKEKIVLCPGQLITGRKKIADKFNISESKVQRILKTFKIEQQIEQQTTNSNRLISILNWEQYQNSEQQTEQPVNNERTTSEQRVNTNKNVRSKECKNVRIKEKEKEKESVKEKNPKIEKFVYENPPDVLDVSNYLNKYCYDKEYDISYDAIRLLSEKFVNFYSSKDCNWTYMAGGNKRTKMKDWEAKARDWVLREFRGK